MALVEHDVTQSLPLEEKRSRAVELYLAWGSYYKVERALGVAKNTVRNWSKTPWWEDLLKEKRLEQQTALDNKISHIVDKSLEIVEDRLINGEQVLNNKTGQLVTKPVALRDAVRVTSDLLARQTQLRKQQEEETVVQASVKDTLAMLAQEFSKMARLASNKEKAEDIEFVEQVEEEE